MATPAPHDTTAKRGWRGRKVGWPLAALGALLVIGYLAISQFGLS